MTTPTQILRTHIALRESLLILIGAALLGFAYSFVMKKGFFAPPSTSVVEFSSPPVFISYDEAFTFFKNGNVLFVDARHEFDYKLGHIRGAINVPLTDFDLKKSALADVQKDKIIVTYCDGADCNSSIELGKKLAETGFTRVKMFFGGWNEWQQHDEPTEK